MNRIFLILFFFVSTFCVCFAGKPQWNETQVFRLAKDQKAFIKIALKGSEIKEVYEFSWTLYDGLNLVVHTKWRRYPKQLNFSLRRGLELHSQQLFLPVVNPYKDEVRLYLEFQSFKDNKAKIKALLMDKAQRTDVEFWPQMEEEDEQN